MALDSVSLTVTPASQANSVESGGLRVDGRDRCTQPIPAGILSATSGHIRFIWRPRHDAADALKFGFTEPRIFEIRFDGNNWIALRWTAVDRITIQIQTPLGNIASNWTPTGIVSDTNYLVDIIYTPAQIELLIDGVQEVLGIGAIAFGTVPLISYFGTRFDLSSCGDAVFIAP